MAHGGCRGGSGRKGAGSMGADNWEKRSEAVGSRGNLMEELEKLGQHEGQMLMEDHSSSGGRIQMIWEE